MEKILIKIKEITEDIEKLGNVKMLAIFKKVGKYIFLVDYRLIKNDTIVVKKGEITQMLEAKEIQTLFEFELFCVL